MTVGDCGRLVSQMSTQPKYLRGQIPVIRAKAGMTGKCQQTLVPVAGGVHYQVALGDLGHHLHGLGEGGVVHSEMLHGIQVEAHSNAAVVHRRHDICNELLGLEVQPAGGQTPLVMFPVGFQMFGVVGDQLEGLRHELPAHVRLDFLVYLLDPAGGLLLGYQLYSRQCLLPLDLTFSLNMCRVYLLPRAIPGRFQSRNRPTRHCR